MKVIRLIAGLGNPGPQYAATRHNAGFQWLDRLCDEHNVVLRPDSKFHALTGKLARGEREALLLEPQTFMNLSGRSVAAICRFYKLLPEEMLVVHDELDLPPGTARLKYGGGHGGHNGVRDIITQTGSGDFWRLRLGIGHPGHRDEVVDYVLRRPLLEEHNLITEAIGQSLKVVAQLLNGEFSVAMMKLHSKPKSPPAGGVSP
jgi:peptidyl-tRNA hydrolase, PTH1 family